MQISVGESGVRATLTAAEQRKMAAVRLILVTLERNEVLTGDEAKAGIAAIDKALSSTKPGVVTDERH